MLLASFFLFIIINVGFSKEGTAIFSPKIIYTNGCQKVSVKMVSTVSKDTPLSELTIRKYERPFNLPKRELVNKLCLSLGLLQPGDSRDIVVDILYIFLNAKRKELTITEVQTGVAGLRKQFKLPLLGVAESNIRRQIRRLRELYLVEKVKTQYRLTENSNLSEIFDERIVNFILPGIVARVKEYLEAADEAFGLSRQEKPVS